MARIGKKYKEALSKVDREKCYPLEETLELVQKMAFAKCDETVEMAVRLGINPKYSDQLVRGAVALPHGLGKRVRVLVFAKGEKEKEALEAGADYVGAEDLVEKIRGGWMEFDTAIATPDVMSTVSKLGKILGPRGLMPNPKVGTVTFDVARAVREAKSGKVEFKTDKGGIVHAPFGKKSFAKENLRANAVALLETLLKLKPASSKGSYFRSITVSSTYGPGVKADVGDVMRLLK